MPMGQFMTQSVNSYEVIHAAGNSYKTKNTPPGVFFVLYFGFEFFSYCQKLFFGSSCILCNNRVVELALGLCA